MKIIIPGGTGQVGTLLARAFVADGHEVLVLSRNPRKAPWRVLRWDAQTLDARAAGRLGGAEPGAPDAWRFSIEVARSWEQAADAAVVPQTRKVLLRSAMTMSPDRGGVFDVLLGLVRWGLGGASGDGRQFVSWIH